MTPWPWQDRAVAETRAAIAEGYKRLCVTTPTGGGKSLVMAKLAQMFVKAGDPVSIYTNRKMLLEQTSEKLFDERLWHGIRAAGHDHDLDAPLQLSSIQTEHARCIRSNRWTIHPAKLVLVDEFHLHANEQAQNVYRKHQEQGAAVVGFTATPIGIGAVADQLIVAGTVSELMEHKALVPSIHFGPDEPDMRSIKARDGEDLTEKQQRKAMMNDTLWGRVWDNFEKLNPDHKPSILFGPDVAGSIWFAEEFTKAGVRAAHIDAEDVWVDGEWHPSNREVREQVLADSKSGRIVVLCNRFVLREGIDAPWLRHGIFATVFGSLQSYLQAGGRLLRITEGKDHCTIQDHGGNWHRHGSLNDDREWELDCTAGTVYGVRAERLRSKKEKEPCRCPNCNRVWTGASQRCSCGYLLEKCKRSRMVAQSDGTLKEMYGDVFRPRRVCTEPNGPELWKRMFFRSISERGAKTFNQAMALFAVENDWRWPDKSWPYMPTDERDYFRLCADVPREKLVQEYAEVVL